jgi:hypothetical protein
MRFVETPVFTRAVTAYMLYAYTKQEQGDLTPQQVKVLSRLVREEFK